MGKALGGKAMRVIKSFVRSAKRLFWAAGYDVHRLASGDPGRDPLVDMVRLVRSQRRVTIFDVGANVGQTIQLLRVTFPQATIHAFEPGNNAFKALRENCSQLKRVHINNFAVGSRLETREFMEGTISEMSS